MQVSGIKSKVFWCACISNLVSGCQVLLYELVQQQHQAFSGARPIFRQLGEINLKTSFSNVVVGGGRVGTWE